MTEKNTDITECDGLEEEFRELDMDGLDYGFDDEDMEEVLEEDRGDRFEHSGVQCKIKKQPILRNPNDPLSGSNQDFWIVSAETPESWTDEMLTRSQELFESTIYDVDEDWISVKAGHERVCDRSEAEDEAEWLAEQVIMISQDPDTPT